MAKSKNGSKLPNLRSQVLTGSPLLSDPIPTEEVGYCRVSDGRDQDPEFQIALMRKRGIPEANIFVDRTSGRNMARPGLDKALMLMEQRAGWTLVVWKLDRLGRNTLGLIELAQQFRENDWNLISLTEPIDTRTPFGKFFFTTLAGFTQLESDTTAERTRAGMARLRELGVPLGRRSTITRKQFREMERMLLHEPKMTIKEIGKEFKVSASCVNHHFPSWRSKTDGQRLTWRKKNPLPDWE